MSWAVVYGLQAGMVGVGLLALYFALSIPTLLCLATLGMLYYGYTKARRKAAGTLPLDDKTVLITGCDTGIGHALAKYLHERGCHVIATVFRPEGQGATALRDVKSERMTVLPLDVSSDDSVAECLRHVKGICANSGLWGVVNNAGHNFVGDVELTTMRQYLLVANINIYGMVKTTRAFLPLLRQTRGRIVNVTSIKGQISRPLNAAYNITKYGGETFSEITRMEMRQFGVKVSIIEPGHFGGVTGCINKDGIARIRREFDEMWAEASDEVKEVFSRDHFDKIMSEIEADAGRSHPTLTPVVKAISDALFSGDPDYRYIVDGSNQLLDKDPMLVRVKPFLSDRLFDALVSYFYL
ncbi:D-beta-hydroxybutyrate dehydrogenase, mitochondrial-like [Littorina saxatilis]|uniref:Uncharacterized protein n=1 Tax=Littorina saxatilis TaxID=31220 RepID=A0AAN9BU46_9CAEN